MQLLRYSRRFILIYILVFSTVVLLTYQFSKGPDRYIQPTATTIRSHSDDELYCHNITSEDSLPDISDNPPSNERRNIFFLETSCTSYNMGKVYINARQACAVESAARMNPDMDVYLLFASPGVIKDEISESDRILQLLRSYSNIKILHFNVNKYVKDTPVETLWTTGKIKTSAYQTSHTSDVIRFLTLWKFGGIYMDLDIIVLKTISGLPENFAAAESSSVLGSAVLGFSKYGQGHEYIDKCVNDVGKNFNGTQWGYNGPDLISRSAKEQYGDNAISYVQLKRENETCIVKCKITPEHKIHKKAYNVVAVVNETEQKILSCDCTDCVASSGGCKHAVAFLFWLHRRHEEPSSTSKECYWKASTLSKVGRQDAYMSIKDIAEKDRSSLGPKNQNIVVTLLNAVGKQDGGIFDLYYESPINSCDIFHNIIKFKECSNTTDPDTFLEFLKTSNKHINLQTVEKATKMQSKCADWYKMRFGRITASILYETAKCKTVSGYLMEKIMGAAKPLETDAVSRGKRLEPEVIKCVEKIRNIVISSSGIILHQDYPILGASPDGVSAECVVEVKCPSKIKTIDNYIKDGVINKKYYLQLQLNMFFLHKTVGLFCVASPNFEQDKKVDVYEVQLEENDLKIFIDMSMSYWKTHIFPELIKIGS